MKRKELKNLAQKIAKQELRLQQEDISPEEKKDAEMEITRLCGKVTCLEDMIDLDDLVQELVSEKTKN